jgi:FkbM family methyltransferase
LNSENDRWSGEEHWIGQLPSLLKGVEQPIVFDVGANIGRYSAKIRRTLPTARLFAFEPHPVSFSQLISQAETLQFQAINIAFSSTHQAEGQLYNRPGSGSEHASLFESAVAELYGESPAALPVRIETLDRFCDAYEIQEIDFLKLDTEGSEFDILTGAENLRIRRAIRCIQFEFNSMNVYSRTFLKDFRALLPEYRFFRLLPDGIIPIEEYPVFLNEIFAYQNIVALRQEPPHER